MRRVKRTAAMLPFWITFIPWAQSAPVFFVHPQPNYHLVGWFNTFIPGGGKLLLGNLSQAGIQAGLEVATFGLGYSISRLTPLTLDGVPEDLPVRGASTIQTTKKTSSCNWEGSGWRRRCIPVTTTTTVNQTVVDETVHDFSVPIFASVLQEFGIKYHMVNVFESYREAATLDDKITDPWIDTHTTKDLFLAPFKWKNIINPWVAIPLGLVAAGTILDYRMQAREGISSLTKMDTLSNVLFAFNYAVWEPIGSGAPEEMFYRGFLQNEFYHLIGSPFFSVPAQAALFAFSHGSSGRIGATISGTYLGTLAHLNHGNLTPGITLHFWSVVMLGIETTFLTLAAQGDFPIQMATQFSF